MGTDKAFGCVFEAFHSRRLCVPILSGTRKQQAFCPSMPLANHHLPPRLPCRTPRQNIHQSARNRSNTPNRYCLMTIFKGLKLFRRLSFELRSFEARNFTNSSVDPQSALKLRMWLPPLTSQKHWVPDLYTRGRESKYSKFEAQ